MQTNSKRVNCRIYDEIKSFVDLRNIRVGESGTEPI